MSSQEKPSIVNFHMWIPSYGVKPPEHSYQLMRANKYQDFFISPQYDAQILQNVKSEVTFLASP